jgi:hypothetical protein
MGRRPRYELDYMISKILEYQKSLRYKELVEEVNLRCKAEKPTTSRFNEVRHIGYNPEQLVKKPPNSTFDRHLVDLEQRGVLHRQVHKDRSTHYSLTNEFQRQLDKQKKKHPTTYVEWTLEQFPPIPYPSRPESESGEKSIEFIEDSLEDKKS